MSSDRSRRRKTRKEFCALIREIQSPGIIREDSGNTLCQEYIGNLGNHYEHLVFKGSLNSEFSSENLHPTIQSNQSMECFNSKLSHWAIKHNITSCAVDDLLSTLNEEGLQLPKCSKTLLNTPLTKSYKIDNIASGQYFHFGIKNKLEYFYSQGLLEDTAIIRLTIGVDGLPLSKSSKRQFWPILGSCVKVNSNKPFLIGLYYSASSKPTCFTTFLNPFVNEAMDLMEKGMWFSMHFYKLIIHCIVADAPARNLVKQTVGFNAYHGCERCHDKGKWLGRVVFQSLNSPLRNDMEFIEQTDKAHHAGISPLLKLNIGLVSEVPLNYMHLVCLGVVKKLLKLWRKGPLIFRIGRHDIEIISTRLVRFKKFIPVEFNRKPRTFLELDFWKATELRSFLLYLGPVALKGVLPQEKYNHFLLLSVALRILLSSNSEWYNYARSLLKVFVSQIPSFYSKECLVYNVHSLIHLADDADKFGPLDSISAFGFENYMQILKRMIRCKFNELAQVIRRVSEYEQVNFVKKALMRSFELKSDLANAVFMLNNGNIVRVVNISDKYLQIKNFNTRGNFFTYPCHSDQLGIYRVSNLGGKIQTVPKTSLKHKFMILPSPCSKLNEYICIPLCGQDMLGNYFEFKN